MQPLDAVKQSFGRCLTAGDVIGRFYEIFLDSHPDIAPRFADTDFTLQKQALRQGINLATLFAGGSGVGRSGIERIRETHQKTRLNIPPELYPYWKESFIQAVAELDPEIDDDLAAAWDDVLQQTIDFIIAGYEPATPSHDG